ncbi:MAG: L-rhamnose mutarotase [Niabella sp.]
MKYFAGKINSEEMLQEIKSAINSEAAFYALNHFILVASETEASQKFLSPPLERVFLKPIKKPYLDSIYKRHVMSLALYPASLEKYIAVHQEVWPQILDNMDAIGVYAMEIYLWKNQAFMIMDTRPDFDMEKDGAVWAKMPREKEWQAYVAAFQKVDANAQATEKWVLMKKV